MKTMRNTAIIAFVSLGLYVYFVLRITSLSAPADTHLIAQALTEKIQEHIASALSVRVGIDGSSLILDTPEGEKYISTHDGRLVIRSEEGGEYISPHDIYVSSVRFMLQGDRIVPSFILVERISYIDALTRVSAATFDDDLSPAATGTYKIGAGPAEWSSINNLLHFDEHNVGISTSTSFTPTARLHIDNGDIYLDRGDETSGLIIRKSSLSCWRVNLWSGVLTTSSIDCP